MLVGSAQNQSISSEICPENNHKIRRFFTDCFSAKFALKIPAKSAYFSVILSHNPAKFDFFFRNLSEAPLLNIVLIKWGKLMYGWIGSN